MRNPMKGCTARVRRKALNILKPWNMEFVIGYQVLGKTQSALIPEPLEADTCDLTEDIPHFNMLRLITILCTSLVPS